MSCRMPALTPLAHIRRNVLGMTQAALAELTGATQPTVSRWDRGDLEPDRSQMARIRDFAQQQGHRWNDRWFFEVPR